MVDLSASPWENNIVSDYYELPGCKSNEAITAGRGSSKGLGKAMFESLAAKSELDYNSYYDGMTLNNPLEKHSPGTQNQDIQWLGAAANQRLLGGITFTVPRIHE